LIGADQGSNTVAQARPDLGLDLDRIVRRCLEKAPDRRYQSALDIRNDLQRLQPAPAVPDSVVPARRIVVLGTGGVVAGLALAAAASYVVPWPFGDTGAPPPRVSFDRLTSRPGAELFPSLSPDGQWIVYAGEGDGNRDVYLQGVGGQTPINLTADSADDDDQPAFSPDGERIVFRSGRGGGGLFVMGRTGEGVRRLTSIGFNPAWSPDSTHVVYTTMPTEIRPRNAEQRGELMVVPAEGGSPRRLYDGVGNAAELVARRPAHRVQRSASRDRGHVEHRDAPRGRRRGGSGHSRWLSELESCLVA
jgi:dipeptidyl aminopeptidase/acylaminoacyl peptidase